MTDLIVLGQFVLVSAVIIGAVVAVDAWLDDHAVSRLARLLKFDVSPARPTPSASAAAPGVVGRTRNRVAGGHSQHN